MFAVIQQGGKQYRVKEGDIVKFDKMSLEPKSAVSFDKVLAADGKIGTPYLENAKIEGVVVSEGRDKKIIIFKKRRRKDSKLKKGFRASYTQVQITKISV